MRGATLKAAGVDAARQRRAQQHRRQQHQQGRTHRDSTCHARAAQPYQRKAGQPGHEADLCRLRRHAENTHQRCQQGGAAPRPRRGQRQGQR